MSNTWEEYYERTKNSPPREGLVKALTFLNNYESALDLGAGALNDSIFLIEQGFSSVTAVDKVPVAIAEKLPTDKFKYVISSIEEFEFPVNKYDLVNAQFSLPFINPSEFYRVFENITASLKEGGVLSGQFFGNKDEWNTNPEMTFHSRQAAMEQLEGFEQLHFDEIEKDSKTAMGILKRWHIFNFIVRK